MCFHLQEELLKTSIEDFEEVCRLELLGESLFHFSNFTSLDVYFYFLFLSFEMKETNKNIIPCFRVFSTLEKFWYFGVLKFVTESYNLLFASIHGLEKWHIDSRYKSRFHGVNYIDSFARINHFQT